MSKPFVFPVENFLLTWNRMWPREKWPKLEGERLGYPPPPANPIRHFIQQRQKHKNVVFHWESLPDTAFLERKNPSLETVRICDQKLPDTAFLKKKNPSLTTMRICWGKKIQIMEMSKPFVFPVENFLATKNRLKSHWPRRWLAKTRTRTLLLTTGPKSGPTSHV